MNKSLMFFIFLTVLIFGCQKQELATIGNITFEENLAQESLVQKEEYNDGLNEALEELKFIENIDSRDVKYFRLKAYNWSFDPIILEVNKDDYVIFNIISLDNTYDLKLTEFLDYRTIIYPGNTSIVEFIPNQSGTFRFFCTIQCQSHPEMSGILVVKE